MSNERRGGRTGMVMKVVGTVGVVVEGDSYGIGGGEGSDGSEVVEAVMVMEE